MGHLLESGFLLLLLQLYKAKSEPKWGLLKPGGKALK
jgi:hypothetical protein